MHPNRRKLSKSLKNPLYRLLMRLDRTMQRLVLRKPSPLVAKLWLTALTVLLSVAFLARLKFGGQLTVDLFVVPILVATIVFKRHGLWVLLVASFLYTVAGFLCDGVPSRYVGFNTAGQVLEWAVLSLFVIITLDRYSEVKKLQNRTDQDLALARKLQSSMIPPNYRVGTVRIEGFVRQTHNLGGDFYYLRPFQQKYVVVCLGDVMGKGTAASLMMAIVMGFLFEWGKKTVSPVSVLKTLNQQLCTLSKSSATETPFVTLFYAVYNEESTELTYSLAGHQSGILLRKDGTNLLLATEGIPVGIFEDASYVQQSVFLDQGDRVILFTDGVAEARNIEGEMFGTDRILTAAVDGKNRSIQELLETIKERVLSHSTGEDTDDIAVLILETCEDTKQLSSWSGS